MLKTLLKNVCGGIVIFTLSVACTVQESSDFEKFTGRWTLHVVEVKSDSLHPWIEREGNYKDRNGFIMYDGLGGMGVHHVPGGYDDYRFEGESLQTLTEKDLRHVANNFVYFGKYRVIDSLGIIEHHIESSVYPHRWGSIARRNYVFDGDTLTLYPIRDGYPKGRLKWVRLNDLD